jgi:DNA-binding transcriptional regulator YiaG
MVKLPQQPCCTHQLKEYKATPEAPYHYKDAGLPNVYLAGIRYYICEICQQIVKAEIPAIKDLLDAIARAIVTKHSPLKGVEARYLRKRLGIKATEFAAILDSSPEQLSRWENEHNEIRGATDRLIRLAYTFLSKDSKLKAVVSRVQQAFDKWSTSIHETGTSGERIAASYKANRQWIAETEMVAA